VSSPEPGPAWPRHRTLLLLALACFALEAAALTRYGWFRDEFYYLACADHPALGYVDQPPLSIWLLAGWRALFGESLAALRLLPAFVGAATVYLTGALAAALGGSRPAQAIAAVAALATPTLLGTFHYCSMNSFDLLLWLVAFHLWVRALETGSSGDWLKLGSVLGLGLLDKISVLWLLAGIAGGLLLTSHRRQLARPGPWLGAGLALALFSPYVLWNAAHHWPTLEFMRNATVRKMVATGPLEFWQRQLLTMNPANALVWLPGLAWLLFDHDGKRWRPLGLAFAIVAGILMLGGRSRASYLAPAYLALFAAGGVALERRLTGPRGAWARGAVVVLVVGLGAVSAPLALPLLPVERFIAYSRSLGLAPGTEEHHRMGPLPQQYADMFGWPELVDEVANAWASLTPEERTHAAIFGQNYGEAGAVEVLGRARGLRPVLSGHNNFWLWGPPVGRSACS
jgi:4-amino-4-deoxy-L-arabinose transferase-like glycosyltransferase